MIASSFGDPVLGIDVHFELVPTPAPVPTPVPNPFTGIVFDPLGLAVGIALGAAIGAVMGAPFQGPVLYWTAFPATNTGTEAKHVPGHILIPPGTAWAPFPKAPKPVIRPGETPSPPNPVVPENDAVVITGSKTVSVMGSNAVRLGDIALSCSEPLRLPSSVVLAVPKGPPILVGGPMSLDLMAALMASLRTRFMSDSLHALISRLSPGRFRNALHRVACFFTGHPVDVASGRLMTETIDAELLGPLPMRIERIYSSAFAGRGGPVGHGWSLSIDQAVWRERGQVVLLAEDGREVVFDTFDLPGHRIEPGQEVFQPIDALTLRCHEHDRFEIVDACGIIRHFAPVAGRDDARAVLHRVVSRCGHHCIELHYDAHGRVDRIKDSGGRINRIEYDPQGRVQALLRPDPEAEGFQRHRHYEYDTAGDLVAVTDSLGAAWCYEYVGHLLTREIDRNGLSFYFMYDGMGEDAYCVRTWGDDGIYDHVISYDKREKITYVTDSRGHVRQYHMNAGGLVTEIVDPLGGRWRYEYDPQTLRRIVEIDPAGNRAKVDIDPRGRTRVLERADRARAEFIRDAQGNLGEFVDPNEGRWSFSHDARGLRLSMRDPLGHTRRYGWSHGVIVSTTSPTGRTETYEYDRQSNRTAVRVGGQVRATLSYDRLGRIVTFRNALGQLRRFYWDAENRIVRIDEANGNVREYRYDGEGSLIGYRDGDSDVYLERAGFRWLVARTEAGKSLRFEYDTEGHRTAVINELGESYRLEYDECGRAITEIAYDGATIRYRRRPDGLIVHVDRPNGLCTELDYDEVGRVLRADHDDGTFERFAYRADGTLVEAESPDMLVRFERDALGRLVREWQGDEWIAYEYGYTGAMRALATSWGHHHHFTFDDREDVTGVVIHDQLSARRAVDLEGRETARSFSGGVSVSWGRDASGRIQARRIATEDGVVDRVYERTPAGAICEVVDSEAGATRVRYDERGRVVGEVRPDGTEVDRVMDDVGNPYRRKDGRDRDYASGNRLKRVGDTSFDHDEAGFLVRRHDPGGATWHYRWTTGGLLREVERPDGSVVRFRYDALGRRVAKEVDEGEGAVPRRERWLWNQNTPLQVRVEDDVETWVFEPQTHTPLIHRRGASTIGFAPTPGGAVTHGYDQTGQLRFRMELDLWGQPVVHHDTSWLQPRFPGQYADDDVELYYNRFRYYDPRQGRYISPDPTGLGGGPALYAYVPDPYLQTDPLGLHTVIGAMDGEPMTTASGDPRFRNTGGRNAPMAASGYGRAGHSENLLMDSITPRAGSELVIESIDSTNPRTGGRWSALDPCFRNGDGCFMGLQRFATDNDMVVRYRVTAGGQDLPDRVGLRNWLVEYVFDPDPSKTTVRRPESGPCR